MHPPDITTLLNMSESDALDFKSGQYKFWNPATDDDKSELLKDVIAFANAFKTGDAFLVIGVSEKNQRKDQVVGVTATQVVDRWGAESADYSRVYDTCASNRQCGHYTQIVWTTTREVGCGMSVCPTLGQVWVCNYRPSGNIRFLK